MKAMPDEVTQKEQGRGVGRIIISQNFRGEGEAAPALASVPFAVSRVFQEPP